MDDERGQYIQTRSGRFWLLDPRPEEVHIGDIAHALSHVCRYAGHSKYLYSVAQHAVLVSYMCDPKDAFWGLMHDDAEAYVGDMTSPLKKLIPEFCTIEDGIFEVIRKKFGLYPETMPPSVLWADMAIVVPEVKALFGLDPVEDWGYVVGDKPHHNDYQPEISSILPKQAAEMFLLRFHELNG